MRESGPIRALSLAALLIVFAAATVSRADADLWGHVRFGLDTLTTGRLTAVDPYSFTQDVLWVNHEWLSEVVMALAYRVAGPAGLTVLKAVLITLVVIVLWTGLDGARLGIRSLVLVVVGFGTIHMWATIRPQLWTLLAFALLCRLLVSRRPAARWWLPVLFACWVNFHGGWVLGLGVLGIWVVCAVVAQPGSRTPWVLVMAAVIVATLANPYGWGLWMFLARTLRMSRSIEEWGPLWGTPWLNWVPWFAAVGLGIWTVHRWSWTRVQTGLVLAVLALLAARVMRVESLFVVAAAILSAPWIVEGWPRVAAAQTPSSGRNARLVWWVAPCGAGVLAVWMMTRALACIPVVGDWAPDPMVVGHLDGAGSGRLVVYFDWGEYAIWHFGPRLRVSMDGRRETVYSKARLAEHDAIVAGTAAGLATLDEWRAEYVWLPARSTLTRRWLTQHGYRIEVATSRSFLAVRADLPALHPLVASGSVRCFPDP